MLAGEVLDSCVDCAIAKELHEGVPRPIVHYLRGHTIIFLVRSHGYVNLSSVRQRKRFLEPKDALFVDSFEICSHLEFTRIAIVASVLDKRLTRNQSLLNQRSL